MAEGHNPLKGGEREREREDGQEEGRRRHRRRERGVREEEREEVEGVQGDLPSPCRHKKRLVGGGGKGSREGGRDRARERRECGR